MRLVGMSPLPFVIAFVLDAKLEESACQALAATERDPWFLSTRPIAAVFMALPVLAIAMAARRKGT